MVFDYAECPLVPMTALTGRPSAEWIRERLKEFRDAGIDQYLLYPRSGCELEYMSGEWLDTCAVFLEESQKLGFRAFWLYDEFNWPSGQCGGRVQEAAKEFALQLLRCEKQPDGSWRFSVQSDKRYPNLLNADAMELFIRLTHEVYAERFGKYFGSFIRGIFTDEPSPGYGANYFCDRNNVRTVPYYPGLEEDYEAMWHSSFRSDLNSAAFAERCQKVVGKRFRENYFDRIRIWCEEHGLLLTGHLMEELQMRNSRNHSGDPLLAISGFGMPGCDEIFTRLTTDSFEYLTFGTAQCGIKQRKNGGLAELFALGPADMPLSRMAAMLNMAGLFGIDHYVLAVSQLDFRGNVGKYGWFNPYSSDQPWWEGGMKLLSAASCRAARLAQRKAAPELAVRYPQECIEITGLLEMLVRKQMPWHITGQEDACTGEQEVIAPCSGGYYLERSGIYCASLEELAERLEKVFIRQVAVLDENGVPDENVFVRAFADGGAFIQDMSDTPSVRKIRICRHGAELMREISGREGIELPAWEVRRNRDNIFRISFGSEPEFEFELTEEMTLNIAVRDYVPVKVELDGAKLAPGDGADYLPKGFQALYRSCTVALKAGRHTFRKISGDDIYAYLPAVWVSGDFALSGRVLSRDMHDGRGLSEYSGRLIQSAEVNIPRNAAGFYLNTDELATEVFMDGKSLGMLIDRPFFWHIPPEYCGKRIRLEICRCVSIGPVFGNVLQFRNFHPAWPDFWSGQYPVRHFVMDMDFRTLQYSAQKY